MKAPRPDRRRRRHSRGTALVELALGAVLLLTLCLGTVDWITQAKLDTETLAKREAEMFETALDALVASRV